MSGSQRFAPEEPTENDKSITTLIKRKERHLYTKLRYPRDPWLQAPQRRPPDRSTKPLESYIRARIVGVTNFISEAALNDECPGRRDSSTITWGSRPLMAGCSINGLTTASARG